MKGRTHLTAGMAVTMLATQPKTITETVMCLGIASVGSVISDIDVSTSKSRRNLNKVLVIITVSVLLIAISEIVFHIGLAAKIMADSSIMRVCLGIALLIAICIYGMNCPHRSFMHSITGLMLITISSYIILPSTALYMCVSIISHILLDIFNKKKIRLFYPLEKPAVALNLCRAGGIADMIIFRLAGIGLVAELILKIVSFLK